MLEIWWVTASLCLSISTRQPWPQIRILHQEMIEKYIDYILGFTIIVMSLRSPSGLEFSASFLPNRELSLVLIQRSDYTIVIISWQFSVISN